MMRALVLFGVCLYMSCATAPAQAADISEADLLQHAWCFRRDNALIIRMQFLKGGTLNQAEYYLDGAQKRSFLAVWTLEAGDGTAKLTRSYRGGARGLRNISVTELSANPDKSLSMVRPGASGERSVTKLVMCDQDVSEKLFH